MKRLVKAAIIASGLFLSSAVLASAGSVILDVTNISPQQIGVYGGPSCSGCTMQTTWSIPSYSSNVTMATASSGATTMDYSIAYYANFKVDVFVVQKVCRATIKLELDGNGNISRVAQYSWAVANSNPTCTTVTPPYVDVNGNVRWDVRYTAM
ncbi:hypothetical protein [Rhizobium sp. BR 314]|uniref:hypothetical protein n=1 Tax=Rhizobium sp. BR 314 TaxID=3040013 RepID=UPI0039BF12C4